MQTYLNTRSKHVLRMVALTTSLLLSSVAFAGEVTLKSADGTVDLKGELVEFKDDNYVIRTALGELAISSSRVRCEGASCPTFDTVATDVHFYGSDTVGLGVMPLLLTGYAASLNAEISVTNTQNKDEILANLIAENGFGDEIGSFLVTSTSSGDAFKGLMDDDAAIGMASRRIKPAEARALRDAGKGNMVSIDQEHVLAVDSLVVIVNPENGIETVSIDDLKGIFSGAITNWSQLGGADLPIQVVTRKEGSGTLAVFQKRYSARTFRPIPKVPSSKTTTTLLPPL